MHRARQALVATMLGTAISVSAGTTAVAQTVAVPNAATCPRCTFAAETLFTLGTTDADMLAPNGFLARDSRGRFFGTGFGGQTVVVWDSSGKYLQTIGGPGQGPGEISQPISRIVIGRGDSIFVAERSLRVSVFSPNLAFVRTIRLHARPNNIALLPNGQMLLGTEIQSAAGIGHPFHVVDGITGTVVRSFGLDGTVIVPGQPVDQRSFTSTPDGSSLWSVDRSKGYRLERWGIDGTRREILDMSATPWFEMGPPLAIDARTTEELWGRVLPRATPATRDSIFRALSANAPPRSSLQIAGIASSGQVWVLTTEAVTSTTDPKTVKRWLEIIDPATRTKVVSTRVPGFFTMLPGTNLTYAKGVDANTGITTLTVARVRIQGR